MRWIREDGLKRSGRGKIAMKGGERYCGLEDRN